MKVIERQANAHWSGNGKKGKGIVNSGSGALKGNFYSCSSRFENGKGTNPEELIGAAHAGCFTMQLAFNLEKEGITPESIDTNATVVLEDDKTITKIQLETNVEAEGLTNEKLQKLAEDAKENCPVSRLLKADIKLLATLVRETETAS